jgi:hypothetical protein
VSTILELLRRLRRFRLAIGFLCGALAAVGETIFTSITHVLKISPIEHEMAIGYTIVHSVGVSSWLVGFLVHLAGGGFLGCLFVLISGRLQWRGVLFGVLFGFCFWYLSGLLVVSAMPGLDFVIPQQATRPDPLWTNYGQCTFYVVAMSHLLFGGVVGKLVQRCLL